MRMGYGLNLEQTQKLVMTPELRQAIVILQLSTLELAEYLQQEVLENPVLEIKEEGEEKEEPELKEVLDVKEQTDAKDEKEFDLDWQEYFQDGSDLGYIRAPKEHDKEEFSYENFLAEAPTLQEHLLFQLHLSPLDTNQMQVGEFLIGNMDDHGYLRTTVEEVSQYFAIPVEDVLEVLKVIQGFDPPGVGARDITECLLIQLEQRENVNPEAKIIVEKYLADLAAGRLNKIARELNMDVLQVQYVSDLIKTLDPKPGRKFGSTNDVRYIVPDVVVERVGGEFIVLVNDTSGPRLGINPLYQAMMHKDARCDEETKRFIENKLNAAAWVIKSIEQRRLTLYRVVNCIVDFQKEFFEKGIKYLKPLNLKQVADVLGMHESTVSRATANKYIQTPQGVFELKFFFASGVDTAAGTTSAESIKRTIQELIRDEDPKKPYTDQQITNILTMRGIKISRRTVAKYRDELAIPSTAKRKRY